MRNGRKICRLLTEFLLVTFVIREVEEHFENLHHRFLLQMMASATQRVRRKKS